MRRGGLYFAFTGYSKMNGCFDLLPVILMPILYSGRIAIDHLKAFMGRFEVAAQAIAQAYKI
jgi:hypothetical protein